MEDPQRKHRKSIYTAHHDGDGKAFGYALYWERVGETVRATVDRLARCRAVWLVDSHLMFKVPSGGMLGFKAAVQPTALDYAERGNVFSRDSRLPAGRPMPAESAWNWTPKQSGVHLWAGLDQLIF